MAQEYTGEILPQEYTGEVIPSPELAAYVASTRAPGQLDISLVPKPLGPTEAQERLRASMTPTDVLRAGAAVPTLNIVRGVGQRAGDIYETVSGQKRPSFLPSEADVAATREREDWLMSQPLGKTGAFISTLADYYPLSWVPGAGTTGGAATLGGLAGAFQPSASTPEFASNVALGAATPVLLQSALKATGRWLGMKPDMSSLSPQEQEVQSAIDRGFKVAPSEARTNRFMSAIQGLAGEAKTEKRISLKNAPLFNQAVNQDIQNSLSTISNAKINGGRSVRPADIITARNEARKIYDAVKDLTVPIKTDPQFENGVRSLASDWQQATREFKMAGNKQITDLVDDLLDFPQAGRSTRGILEYTRQLRADGVGNMKAFDDPQRQALGIAQREASDLLESLIERNMQKATGLSGWVQPWRNARTLFAKTYDVEAALNPQTGNIDAGYLARLIKKGKPLTGGIEEVGKFATAFPASSRAVEKMRLKEQFGIADVLLAMGSGAAMHNPAYLAAIAARPAAREALAAGPVQSGFLAPGVSPDVERFLPLAIPLSQALAYRPPLQTTPYMTGQ